MHSINKWISWWRYRGLVAGWQRKVVGFFHAVMVQNNFSIRSSPSLLFIFIISNIYSQASSFFRRHFYFFDLFLPRRPQVKISLWLNNWCLNISETKTGGCNQASKAQRHNAGGGKDYGQSSIFYHLPFFTVLLAPLFGLPKTFPCDKMVSIQSNTRHFRLPWRKNPFASCCEGAMRITRFDLLPICDPNRISLTSVFPDHPKALFTTSWI